MQGLLQSETEGVDNENVGFYGRCLLHATYQSCLADSNSVDTQVESPRNKEFSCARIEVCCCTYDFKYLFIYFYKKKLHSGY